MESAPPPPPSSSSSSLSSSSSSSAAASSSSSLLLQPKKIVFLIDVSPTSMLLSSSAGESAAPAAHPAPGHSDGGAGVATDRDVENTNDTRGPSEQRRPHESEPVEDAGRVDGESGRPALTTAHHSAADHPHQRQQQQQQQHHHPLPRHHLLFASPKSGISDASSVPLLFPTFKEPSLSSPSSPSLSQLPPSSLSPSLLPSLAASSSLASHPTRSLGGRERGKDTISATTGTCPSPSPGTLSRSGSSLPPKLTTTEKSLRLLNADHLAPENRHLNVDTFLQSSLLNNTTHTHTAPKSAANDASAAASHGYRHPPAALPQFASMHYQAVCIAVLRLLTHLHATSVSELPESAKVQWGFKFFNSSKSQAVFSSKRSFQAFTDKHFADFQSQLLAELSGALVSEPPKGRPAADTRQRASFSSSTSSSLSPSSSAASSVKPIASITEVLKQVLTDFQWREPSFTSPVKGGKKQRIDSRPKSVLATGFSAPRDVPASVRTSLTLHDHRTPLDQAHSFVFLLSPCPQTSDGIAAFMEVAGAGGAAASTADSQSAKRKTPAQRALYGSIHKEVTAEFRRHLKHQFGEFSISLNWVDTQQRTRSQILDGCDPSIALEMLRLCRDFNGFLLPGSAIVSSTSQCTVSYLLKHVVSKQAAIDTQASRLDAKQAVQLVKSLCSPLDLEKSKRIDASTAALAPFSTSLLESWAPPIDSSGAANVLDVLQTLAVPDSRSSSSGIGGMERKDVERLHSLVSLQKSFARLYMEQAKRDLEAMAPKQSLEHPTAMTVVATTAVGSQAQAQSGHRSKKDAHKSKDRSRPTVKKGSVSRSTADTPSRAATATGESAAAAPFPPIPPPSASFNSTATTATASTSTASSTTSTSSSTTTTAMAAATAAAPETALGRSTAHGASHVQDDVEAFFAHRSSIDDVRKQLFVLFDAAAMGHLYKWEYVLDAANGVSAPEDENSVLHFVSKCIPACLGALGEVCRAPREALIAMLSDVVQTRQAIQSSSRQGGANRTLLRRLELVVLLRLELALLQEKQDPLKGPDFDAINKSCVSLMMAFRNVGSTAGTFPQFLASPMVTEYLRRFPETFASLCTEMEIAPFPAALLAVLSPSKHRTSANDGGLPFDHDFVPLVALDDLAVLGGGNGGSDTGGKGVSASKETAANSSGASMRAKAAPGEPAPNKLHAPQAAKEQAALRGKSRSAVPAGMRHEPNRTLRNALLAGSTARAQQEKTFALPSSSSSSSSIAKSTSLSTKYLFAVPEPIKKQTSSLSRHTILTPLPVAVAVPARTKRSVADMDDGTGGDQRKRVRQVHAAELALSMASSQGTAAAAAAPIVAETPVKLQVGAPETKRTGSGQVALETPVRALRTSALEDEMHTAAPMMVSAPLRRSPRNAAKTQPYDDQQQQQTQEPTAQEGQGQPGAVQQARRGARRALNL